MGGLFDLIFIALILWWIFRALGGGRRRTGGGGVDAPSPGERAPGERVPGERPAGVGASAEEPEWRRRLKEAVRDWEVEQRRRAGEPVPGPYGRPEVGGAPRPAGGSGRAELPEEPRLERQDAERPAAASARTEAPPRPLEQEPSSRPFPRPTPPPGRAGPPPFPRPRPAPTPPRAPPSPHRRPPGGRPGPRRPAPGDGRRREEPTIAGRAVDLGPQIGKRGEAGDLAAAGEAPGARRRGRSGHRALELTALRGLSDLQRAIVYQDILGPPRAATPPAHDPWF